MRRLLTWLLSRGVPASDREALLGDLAEEYDRRRRSGARGRWRADVWHVRQLAIASAHGVAGRWQDLARGLDWRRPLDGVARDARVGLRAIRQTPGFSLLACGTLAVGIGASTAIFSAVNPILFEPLPYPAADRLVTIWYAGADGSRVLQAFGTFHELAARSRTLDSLAVAKAWQPAMTGSQEPERLVGQRVSATYFRTLGVAPALGQDFRDADDRLNGPSLVMLSDGLWRRRFAADRGIVGRIVTLDDAPFTVAGVMPEGFEDVLAPAAEAWAPLQFDVSLDSAWGHQLRMVGRRRADAGFDDLARDLAAIARTPDSAFPRKPWASLNQGLIVSPLKDDAVGAVKPALVAVLGAVMLLVLIACVNVTNPLLTRGAERRGEFAVRVALGAGRARLVRQLLAESLMMALSGGLAGVALAVGGVRALIALSPPGLPRAGASGVNGSALAFAAILSTCVGLAIGLMPALLASRRDPQAGLQRASRRTTGGHRTTRHVLVVAEIALAIVLLVCAGLLLRSLQRLFAIDPGFDPSHLVSMQIQTSARRFDKAATDRFFADALDAVRRVPGVAAAAFTSQLPLSGDDDEYGAHFESVHPNEGRNVFRYAVSAGYCETAGIPLRRGRAIDARDTADAPPVALISESLARQTFGDRDPIGQRLHVGPTDLPWFTIVGVVGDVRQVSLALEQPDAVYLPAAQSWFAERTLSLVVRGLTDPLVLTPAIREAVWSVDRNQPIVRVARMDDLVARTAAGRRFALTLLEVFAGAALLLAALGIYGVLSGSVAERMREIGVRAALGASRRDIAALVFRQGLSLMAAGVTLGAAAAALASRAVVTLLFGVSRIDPATYLSVAALLALVATAACWAPAWRAARVDPIQTLRME